MKTANLILTLALVFTAVFVNAQDSQPAEPTAPAGGFVSLEVVDLNGIPVRGEVSTPRFPDEHMPRAACCVQPEQGKFQKSPIISAIESFVNNYTKKAFVPAIGKFVNVCDKVGFIAAINDSGIFDEIKKQYSNGVVLQLRVDTIHPSAIVCLSK